MWNAIADSPAVLFNRGMANLFLGNLKDARAALSKAIDQLPDDQGWNSLARLYLAVAEIYG
jgi:tetratricopeptide (TPR) repeat protein